MKNKCNVWTNVWSISSKAKINGFFKIFDTGRKKGYLKLHIFKGSLVHSGMAAELSGSASIYELRLMMNDLYIVSVVL